MANRNQDRHSHYDRDEHLDDDLGQTRQYHQQDDQDEDHERQMTQRGRHASQQHRQTSMRRDRGDRR